MASEASRRQVAVGCVEGWTIRWTGRKGTAEADEKESQEDVIREIPN